MNSDSILNTIKKLLGIHESYLDFDPDIIVCINTAFSILHQLGVGPEDGFSISGETETWSDFISGDPAALRMIRSYIYMKCRLMFDPPQTAALLSSMENSAKELEWRINVEVDPSKQ